MIESLHFEYDGISSQDMGIIQVSQGSGLYEEIFFANKTINEQKVRGKDSPYFFGVNREPISFPIRLYFQANLTDSSVRAIARWLDQDYFKKFYFLNNPNRIMYGMFHGDSKVIHNGIKQGYLTLEFRTNSPYFFTPITLSPLYDYSANGINGTELVFTNDGDITCKPILILTKTVENGDIRVVNKTKSNEELKLADIVDGEIITIDNEIETIETGVIGVYRYSNHNGTFLSLVRGENRLQIYGKCKVQLKYNFKIISSQ